MGFLTGFSRKNGTKIAQKWHKNGTKWLKIAEKMAENG
jgi:hypothetical protein